MQYVLGQADFADRVFHVEPGILIPRPETAELCRWITADCSPEAHILDICTGSGCIAITLALNIGNAEVTGWDISTKALRIAQENARILNAPNVKIEQKDALNLHKDTQLYDIIVSNPPYICEKEKVDMAKNVLEHEPSIALFVPDDDPLRFYRAIAEFAATQLRSQGKLYFEINPIYEKETRKMLDILGFKKIETKVDAFGKERMMKAIKP